MRLRLCNLALLGATASLCMQARLYAQTHAVAKAETVVRAIAVFEWTGDEAKPTASRLVPVSLFINGQLEDADLYMARPVPFALDRGTVFEAQKAGASEGTLQVAYQRHVETSGGVPLDNTWIGYGPLKVNAAEPVVTARQSGPVAQIVVSGGKGPRFDSKPDAASGTDKPAPTDRSTAAGAGTTVSADPAPASTADNSKSDADRPSMRRRTDSDSTKPDSTTKPDDTSASKDDADGPTMRRRTNSADATQTSDSTTDSKDDAERPTLKKRTPTQSKQDKKRGDQASVTSAGSLNDDPDRPTLHRGSALAIDANSLPPLIGNPPDMRQMVAVSDARDRPEHDFNRPWESANERHQVLVRMQELARQQLADYQRRNEIAATPQAVAPIAPKTNTAARKRAATPAAVAPAPAAPDFTDDKLSGYTLSYGGASTFVYTATSPAADGVPRYLTIITQQDPQGDLKLALASITDAKHLDRTPWMRLVDVVDAEASNRASLLFELRATNTRQFALYRVIGAKAEQTFATGTTE